MIERLALVVALGLGCGGDKASTPPEVTPPAGDPDEAGSAATDILIDPSGAVAVMGVPTKSDEDLDAALRAVASEHGDLSCAIRADLAVPYARTVAITDRCVAAGARDIAINGVPIAVPRAGSGGAERTFLAVSVDANGDVYVAGQRVQEDDITPRLREALAQPGLSIAVLPDGGLPTGRVVVVWKRVREAGVDEIELVRTPAPRPKQPELPAKRP